MHTNWISQSGYVHQPPISSREECDLREGVCSYCREHCEINEGAQWAFFGLFTVTCHECKVIWEIPRAARS